MNTSHARVYTNSPHKYLPMITGHPLTRALQRRVNIKFISGAVREVCSSNGFAPFSSEALAALHENIYLQRSTLTFVSLLMQVYISLEQLLRKILANLLIISNQDQLHGKMVFDQVISSNW